jgi:nucleolar protein 56
VLVSKSIVGYHIYADNGDVIKFIDSSKTDHETELINTISNEGSVITDNSTVFALLKEKLPVKLNVYHPTLKSARQNRFQSIIDNQKTIQTENEYFSKLHYVAVEETSAKVKVRISGKDTLITQAIYSIDDLTKTYNLLFSRLVEIYNVHFPELIAEVTNQTTYARIISMYSNRSNLTVEILTNVPFKYPENVAKRIIEKAENSLGANLNDEDYLIIKDFAENLIEVGSNRSKLENWIETTMLEYAPNLSAVAGPNVAARLIAKVGGLKELAMKTSSKIQTLGAEKALYKAIRSKGKTPKHGIIFQIPEIGNVPFWLRGRMARAFASKISFASRIDYFRGDFKGEEYRAELRKELETLKKTYPNPPSRKELMDKRKGKQQEKGYSPRRKGKPNKRRSTKR